MGARANMHSRRYGSASPVTAISFGDEERHQGALSAAVGSKLARSWWAAGLRAIAAGGFAIAILLLPQPTLATLAMMFSAYVAADGALAIVMGLLAMQREGLWQALVLEGAINLAVAAAVLIWPAMAAIAFLRLTSAWAIVTGALLIASTRWLPLSRGRWMLTLAGVVSTTWGALASAWGPTATTAPEATAWWLLGYALPFAAALLALAGLLQQDSSAPRPN